MTHIDQAFIKAYGKLAQARVKPAPADDLTPSVAAPSTNSIDISAPLTPEILHDSPAPSELAASPIEGIGEPELEKSNVLAESAPESPETSGIETKKSTPDPASSGNPRVQPLATVLPPREVKVNLAPENKVASFTWADADQHLSKAAAGGLQQMSQQVKSQLAHGAKVVLVTSCSRGEGRTSVALCVARQFAASGLKTALIDSDFRRPAVAPRLGLKPACGWSEVLKGTASLAQAAIVSEAEHLVVLPLFGEHTHSTAALAPRMRLVLGLLRRDYDVVLIDGGPLNEEDSMLLECPQIDAALLVQHARHTADDELWAAEQQLSTAGVQVWGIARNFE